MSQHLPECPMANGCKHDYYNDPPIQCADCGESCICDRLRACEQRVFQEQIAGRQYDMVLGYQRGLARARRAVQMVEKGGKGRRAHELWRDAIAAIDALREKP